MSFPVGFNEQKEQEENNHAIRMKIITYACVSLFLVALLAIAVFFVKIVWGLSTM